MTHKCTCLTCAERGKAIDVAYDHLLSCGYLPGGMVLQMLARHTSEDHSDELQRRLQQSLEELKRQAKDLERRLRDEPRKPWWRRWL